MELPEKVLNRAWEYAIGEFHETIRPSRENSNVFMARLWAKGIFQALKTMGYEVCISKDGKEVWSSKPS